MSTIDPDAVKKVRDERPTTAAQLVLPGILLLFFAGMLAWSITRLAQEPTRNEDDPGAMTLVWLALSALMTLTALGQWMRRAIRNPRLPGWITALGIALLGGAAGHSVVPEPPALFGLPVVDALTLALGAAGLVLLFLGAGARSARTRRIDAEEEIVRTTAPVTGSVTNQGYTHFGDADKILTAVTYSFRDGAGVQRWVKRPATIYVRDPLATGEEVDVWFDPMDPANEQKIVIRRRG